MEGGGGPDPQDPACAAGKQGCLLAEATFAAAVGNFQREVAAGSGVGPGGFPGFAAGVGAQVGCPWDAVVNQSHTAGHHPCAVQTPVQLEAAMMTFPTARRQGCWQAQALSVDKIRSATP